MPDAPLERPLGVTILAYLCLACGPGLAFAGLVWLIVTRNILLIFVPFGAIPMAFGIGIGLVWASFLLVIGLGMLKVKNWARVTLIVLIGWLMLDVTANLLLPGRASLGPRALGLLGLGVGFWLLRYLFKSHVKLVFGRAKSRPTRV